MKFPGRSQREDPYDGISWGGVIEADTSRAGIIDDGLIAYAERVTEARRQWLQAQPEDFEKVGKRSYVDRATGVEYKHVSGTPLLAIGAPGAEGISCFFRPRWEARLPAPGRLAGEVDCPPRPRHRQVPAHSGGRTQIY